MEKIDNINTKQIVSLFLFHSNNNALAIDHNAWKTSTANCWNAKREEKKTRTRKADDVYIDFVRIQILKQTELF